MRKGTTFTRFIIEEQRRIPESTGEFTLLLSAIVTACKEISDDVNRGQLINVLGSAESENVQGETQKKLDIISNEVMIKALEWSGHWREWRRKRWKMSTRSQTVTRRESTCWFSIRLTGLPTRR